MAEIALGDRARDQISDFEGVVTGRCTYISGCDQVLLVPPAKGGEWKEAQWFDVDRCVVVKAGAFKAAQVASRKRPGADKPAPKR